MTRTQPAADKWTIRIARFDVLSSPALKTLVVSRPHRFPHYVFLEQSRCTCSGWQRWKHCSHLDAARAYRANIEASRAKPVEGEAEARRRERGVSEWAREFLYS